MVTGPQPETGWGVRVIFLESAVDVGPRPDPFNPAPEAAGSVPTHFFDESSLAQRELLARETILPPTRGN